jgi:hypothetical protein
VPQGPEIQREWIRQYDEAGPWIESQENLIAASVLPIWNKIQERRGAGPSQTAVPVKVKIGKLDNRTRLIGADIAPHRVREVLKAWATSPSRIRKKCSGASMAEENSA